MPRLLGLQVIEHPAGDLLAAVSQEWKGLLDRPSQASVERRCGLIDVGDDPFVSSDRLGDKNGPPVSSGGMLVFYLTKLAQLGGDLKRAAAPPPGNMVVWRGLTRLTDIILGAESTGDQNAGN